jgi:short-subunit dehydrogenase
MRNALITGGSKGIGRAIATRLTNVGYTVYIASRHSPRDSLPSWRHIKTDFSQSGWKNNLMSIPQIQILVNSVCQYMNIIKENPAAYTSEQLVTYLLSQIEPTLFLIEHFLPHMIKQGEGRIINISSFASRLPTPFAPAYGMSKAVINSYSQSLFTYLKSYNVNIVSCIVGLTKTQHVSKMGWNVVTPEKVAEKCLKFYNKPTVIPCFPHRLHYLMYKLKGEQKIGKEMLLMGEQICRRQQEIRQKRN